MRKYILIWMLFFQVPLIISQGYKEVYSPHVETIEVLALDFWLEDGGKISDTKIVPEMSTFNNSKIINDLITTLENAPLGEYVGEKVRAQFIIKLINPKYENHHLSKSDCDKLDFLKEGKFVYTEPMFQGMTIERNKVEQIERTADGVVMKGKIEWLSNCEYTLQYQETQNGTSFLKETDIMHVEIIGILNDNSVLYKSELNGQVLTGILKKL